MSTMEMDRYEKRAEQLDAAQQRRYAALASYDQPNFFLRKHETEVTTFIAMFRRASKTYQGE